MECRINTVAGVMLYCEQCDSFKTAVENAVRLGIPFLGGDFRGMNLAGAQLGNGNFTGSHFEGANLIGTNFTGANLTNCDFSGADVAEVTWTAATLTGVDTDALAIDAIATISAPACEDPIAHCIVKANSAGKIAAGFGGSASTVATLNSSTKVVQDPANATATPTASKIPIANATGCGGLDAWGYAPTTAGDWAGAAPTTIRGALDRCATLLKALNGGTGP